MVLQLLDRLCWKKHPNSITSSVQKVHENSKTTLDLNVNSPSALASESLAIAGEKLSADLVSADDFVGNFSDLIEG